MTLASSTALGWLVWRREKNKKLLLLKIIAFVRRHVLFSPFESQLGEKVRNTQNGSKNNMEKYGHVVCLDTIAAFISNLPYYWKAPICSIRQQSRMSMCKEGKGEIAFEFLFREILKTMKLKD